MPSGFTHFVINDMVSVFCVAEYRWMVAEGGTRGWGIWVKEVRKCKLPVMYRYKKPAKKSDFFSPVSCKISKKVDL